MSRFLSCLFLAGVVSAAACDSPLAPYQPPADIQGALTADMVRGSKYFVPIEQVDAVTAVQVRWSVGMSTALDGTASPVYVYWQNVAGFEVGPEYVTIPTASVWEWAANKQYRVKF